MTTAAGSRSRRAAARMVHSPHACRRPSAAVLVIGALDVCVEVPVAHGLPCWTSVGMNPA